MKRALVLSTLALAAIARAESAREEKVEVEQKLEHQRATVELLQGQKVGVLQVLELVEKLARGSAARAAVAQTEMNALSRRVALAGRQESIARAEVASRVAQLAPRLTTMYRLTRQNPLEVLLSANDFAQMVWRWRAMGRLVEGDVRLVQEVARAERFQRETVADLSELKAGLKGRMLALKEETARASQQRRDLEELVGLIHAETVQANRVIRELEQADRELTAMVVELEQGPPTSGFASLRGKLPFPADGRIEVGFGKMINPRFNTVTVQKGLDIRAPEGSPVRAVAAGKVVYAGWLRGYGNLLIVEHGEGFHSLFAHLADFSPRVGDALQAGDLVGHIGDTGSLKGAYLYFELRQNGLAVDPALWLAAH